MAAIAALEALKRSCSVTIYSDSRYLVSAMEGSWPKRWKKLGWVKPDGEPVPNADLWTRLLYLNARHRVEFVWLPGHGASEENRVCDELARDVARRPDLPIDHHFEAEQRRKYAARAKARRKRN